MNAANRASSADSIRGGVSVVVIEVMLTHRVSFRASEASRGILFRRCVADPSTRCHSLEMTRSLSLPDRHGTLFEIRLEMLLQIFPDERRANLVADQIDAAFVMLRRRHDRGANMRIRFDARDHFALQLFRL